MSDKKMDNKKRMYDDKFFLMNELKMLRELGANEGELYVIKRLREQERL